MQTKSRTTEVRLLSRDTYNSSIAKTTVTRRLMAVIEPSIDGHDFVFALFVEEERTEIGHLTGRREITKFASDYQAVFSGTELECQMSRNSYLRGVSRGVDTTKQLITARR